MTSMTTAFRNEEKRELVVQVHGGFEIKDNLKKMGFQFGKNEFGAGVWYKTIGFDFLLGYCCQLQKLGVAGA